MFALYGGYALAFWYGMHLYAKHEAKSAGVIITALFSIMIGVHAFSELAGNLGSFMRIRSACEEMFRIIDSKIEGVFEPDSSTGKKTSPTSTIGQLSDIFYEDITFSDISFHYPTRPSVQALSRLSHTFPAGKTTALVGPSGPGKSTIVGLLLKWYDVSNGSISFGQRDGDDLSVEKIRANIGLVQQVSEAGLR
jgi:ATP-binding cassette subfamily B (MDR/TAP) protein 1